MRAKHSPGRNRWVYRALGVLAFLVLASPLLAQETPRQPLDTQALQRVVERDQTLQARLAAIASDKQAFVSEIVSAWADNAETRGFGSTWRQDLENVLMSLSPEKLAAARDAKTYTELRAAVFSPNVLGDNNRDLVYFPVTPCRLVDTRLAGGPIAAGFTRSFVMNGSLTGQGGNASGCGIPVDPAAIKLSLTSTGGAGPGDLRAFPFGGAVPLASVLNFRGPDIASSPIVPTCQICGSAFTIQVDGSATDIVVDIMGYFWSPNATPLETSVTSSAPASVTVGGNFTVFSPACPAGFAVTGGGFDAATFNSVSMATSHSSGNGWICQGTGTAATSMICHANCARVPGR